MNIIYSVKLGEPASEPVTLTQVKANLKIDYSTDDTLLTALITAAQNQIEQYTGVSIADRTVSLIAKIDGFNDFELPYGPVQSITSITQLSILGGTNTALAAGDYSVYGASGEFVNINTKGAGDKYAIVYEAGYTVTPTALLESIIHQIAYLYEHRGDEDIQGYSSTALMMAKPYRRAVI